MSKDSITQMIHHSKFIHTVISSTALNLNGAAVVVEAVLAHIQSGKGSKYPPDRSPVLCRIDPYTLYLMLRNKHPWKGQRLTKMRR